MLPPEIQRVVLLIGMAATAYLLILAWNDDMEAAKVPTVYSEAPPDDAGRTFHCAGSPEVMNLLSRSGHTSP